MTASPTLISARLAIAYATWIRKIAAKSKAQLELRLELLVRVWVLDEVADAFGIGRLHLTEGLQNLELAVLHFGQVHVEDEVVRLRVRRHLAAGPFDRDTGLERLDHRLALDGLRFLHRFGPEAHAHVLGRAEIAEVAVVGAELLAETL